jgi:hypothetical protein
LVVVLSLAPLAAAEQPQPSTFRSEWSDAPPGAWRILRYTSQWGQQTPFTQVIRQTLGGFNSYGRAEYQTEVLAGDEGDVFVEFGLETHTPEYVGLEPQGEPMATTVELLNRKLPVRIKTYEGTDWTDYRVRVTLYESDEISLFPRGLAQWQVDSGYTLGPHVVKAISERFDDEGMSLTIEQELIEIDVPIEVAGRTVTCVVERSRSYRRTGGAAEGDADVITRWLSTDVPGHLVRSVRGNGIGETVTLELVDFGSSPPSQTEQEGAEDRAPALEEAAPPRAGG